MQRLHIASILLLVAYSLNSILPVQAAGDTSVDHIVISEVQVRGAGGSPAWQEFVELYNPTNEPIDLKAENWKLEKHTASASSSGKCEDWTNKPITFENTGEETSGVIQPFSFFLLVTSEFQAANPDVNYNAVFNKPLADGGGHIRIGYREDPDNKELPLIEVDKVGWGEDKDGLPAECAEGSDDGNPVDVSEDKTACFDTWSMKRKFDNDGLIQDTDDNGKDFVIETPSPQSSSDGSPEATATTPAECDEPDEEDPDEPDEEPTPEPDDPVYLKLNITEVLPDPDKPQTDADDEFVELFNPNSNAVNLKGYVLKTGSSLQTVHTFGAATIKAKAYRAFFSRDIKIGLVNSGGKAQLLDPTGTIVSELVSYPKAETSEAWARIFGKWQWTDRVTPGAVNKPRAPGPQPDNPGNQAVLATAPTGPFAKINITELLPDPAAPQTDADDEYVELYNPNDYAVDLTGYVIQTGSNFRSKHIIRDIKIEAKQYIAIFNSTATLSLTNKGGAARLLDPAGKMISTTDTYPKAETGAAWALVGGKWQWTASPTPAASNKLAAIASDDTTTASATASSGQNRARSVLAAPAAVQTNAASNAIVAGAVGSALLYGLYEWRGDLRNQFEKLRRYRRAWRRRRG